jgi:pyruvate,water dikinase
LVILLWPTKEIPKNLCIEISGAVRGAIAQFVLGGGAMSNVYTLDFTQIGSDDHARVGGKCASLGDMTRACVAVPPGFAVTTDAYDAMLSAHGLNRTIDAQLDGLDIDDVAAVEAAAQAIGDRIRGGAIPDAVAQAIVEDYRALGHALPVAVRSSATAEDLPDASFAGQQDTYLWVVGEDDVLEKVRDCWASLYTARAIIYRAKNNIPSDDVKISVAVQKMVNAKAAGVAMTLDPATGDRTKIVIDASFGLGETVGLAPSHPTTSALKRCCWKSSTAGFPPNTSNLSRTRPTARPSSARLKRTGRPRPA